MDSIRTSLLLLITHLLLPVNSMSAQYGDAEKGITGSGWHYFLNGNNMDNWKYYNVQEPGENWKVENNELVATGNGGDIISIEQFEDFELELEYKISEGGNSGIFYHVKESPVFPEVWHSGIEFQVMDNERNPLAKDKDKSASSLYAMYAPLEDASKPAGEWNRVRLKVEKTGVEYWLNGKLVNSYELWTEKWYKDRENSIHNKTRKPLWGEFRKGHIALQDEGFPVAYRNIRIREIPNNDRKPGGTGFAPVTYLDENGKKNRDGHHIHFLLSDYHGTTNGFNSIYGSYTSKEFVITGTHEDQEMFFVIKGTGWALIGNSEIPVYPGACWLVPPHTVHGIKCAANSESVEVFIVHGAP
jgi:mannose-6-phosphate isomerase-like protein (cupin superfamily)